jgi:conjugative relaxase-like TrwC/TraI family protein
MISISKPIKNAKHSKYYTEMVQANYYANRAGQVATWCGKGAELLGLKGEVNPNDLRCLMEGYSTDGKTKLVQNAGRANRQKGWDLVATGPKPFAVMWAMSNADQRPAYERALREAAEDARTFLEDSAGLTRRGGKGQRLEKAHLVMFKASHDTSRDLDPNPHEHMFVVNVCVRDDGSTGSLYTERLHELRKKADLIFTVSLAMSLTFDFGLKVTPEKYGFSIDGVPKEICDHFSKRKRAIDRYKEEHGVDGPEASYIAAIKTRKAKVDVNREELFPYWQKEAESMGWGPQQARALLNEKAFHTFLRQRTQGAEREEFEPKTRTEQQAESEGPEWKNNPARPSWTSWEPAEVPRSGTERKTAGRASRNSNVLKHRRWGDILWNQKLGIAEIRIQNRRLFPNAWSLNPASKLEIPTIRVIPWKIQLFKKPTANQRSKPDVRWKASLLGAELRIQYSRTFPDAPFWSPARKIQLPALKLGWKTSPSKNTPKTKAKAKRVTKSERQAH